ncbi:MepB family protein [Flavobacterium sp. FlaQc-47]|uniref:MepB family protein n=1 Tax=Flavobacterium sp. FlaQc-47 TaxID=3374180 RepID=UPI0037576386
MAITNNWNDLKSLPKDLITVKELVYDCCNFNATEPQREAESADYDAYHFQINEKNICYRAAKITPTKTGQFVTLWKRNVMGIIAPFDFLDTIDFVIVNVRKNNLLGQFIFPKNILLEKGIFSTEFKEGKRATRIYPPWDETTNKQAQKTQQWQLNYFYNINPDLDLEKFKTLF